MRRKHLLTEHPIAGVPQSGEKDIEAIATVLVTSEATDAPIDRVFDRRRGRGGSRWVAAMPGEQRLILAFDTPQTIRAISLEGEEPEVSRTQVLHVSVSCDGGQTYQELRGQEYSLAHPPRRLSERSGRSGSRGSPSSNWWSRRRTQGNPAGRASHQWSCSDAAVRALADQQPFRSLAESCHVIRIFGTTGVRRVTAWIGAT